MNLKQQLKINRRPWIFFGILVITTIWICSSCFSSQMQVTTIYIVRHAEKANNNAGPFDPLLGPPLSVAGQERAKELAHVLKDAEIDAIFVTNFIRTQQTAAPVEESSGIIAQQCQAAETQSLVDKILADHIGGRVLVVGHSNTVDDIAAGLGADGLSDLAEDQFDRLFVVHRFGNIAHLDQLRYGVETPLSEGQIALLEEKEPLSNIDVSRDNLTSELTTDVVATELQEEALEKMKEESPNFQLNWNPTPEEEKPLPNIDVSRESLGDGLIADTVVTKLQKEALEQMKEENPNLQLNWNPITGTPRNLSVRGGFLKKGADSSGIIDSSAENTLRQFIEDEAELFNLTPNDLETLFVVRDTSNEGSGIIAEEVKGFQNVTFDQRWQGKQVYPVSLSGTLSADQNSILSLSGDIVPNLESAINATEPTLSALDALEKTADSIGASFDPQEHPLLENPQGPELRQTFDKGEDFEYDVPVRLIYFLVAKDDVRLVWEVTIIAKGDFFTYQVLVDALTGEILLRENLT